MSNGNGINPPAQRVAAESIQAATYDQPPMLGSGENTNFDWFLMKPAIDGGYPLGKWWSSDRDYQLRQYVRHSVVLSSIVAGRSSQIKNMRWKLNAEDPKMESLLPIYHTMIEQCQMGDGFRQFLDLWCTDYHTQDNGAFIELIGDGDEMPYITATGQAFTARGYLPREKVIGFAHVDAAQVWRTYNREFPFIYRNAWTGKLYIMHWSRMFARASMRQPYERGRGIGFCATSRAFGALEIVQASNDFIFEKMVGASPEIAIATNVAMQAIKDGIKTGEIEMDNKGLIRYKGTIFIKGDVIANNTPDIKLIGLRNVPDGWDREKELQLSILMIAMAFTTDPRDLGWNVGLAGQTKADAEIQDLKTSGRGRADVMNEIEDFFNLRVLPSGIHFEFDNKDDLEDQRKALIAQTRVATRAQQITSGELNVSEAREMAAQQNDIDPIFLKQQTIMSSDENPADVMTKGYSNEVFVPFQNALLAVITRADLSPFVAAGQIDDLCFSYGRQAYLSGIRDGGGGSVGLADLEPDEGSEMNALIAAMTSRSFTLAVDALEMDALQAQERAFLWANKGLDSLYNAGILSGNANQALEWKVGNTKESCPDCQTLNGRVYRARVWKKYKIAPRANELACKGFQCKCELVKTDKPLMRGKPPALSGHKDHVVLSDTVPDDDGGTVAAVVEG